MREQNGVFAAAYFVRSSIQSEAAHLQIGELRNLTAARDRAHAGEKHIHMKGFGQIVVGS